MNDRLERIVRALRKVTGEGPDMIALHEPTFLGNERAYVLDCIDTKWVSSAGRYVNQFEGMIADYTGARFAIAVVNGTAALHATLLQAGVGAGDEVIVPTLTFIATANAVAYCGASLHLADSERYTLGLDIPKLEQHLADCARMRDGVCTNRITGARIRAVVPMHTFGHPVDLEPLLELCAQYRLTLIEDAAESLGTLYKGRHTGTWGQMGVFSFNGNKIVTTGGGGAIVTNDESIAKRLKHLTTTSRVAHQWTFAHDEVGYNYRMPNINAALGCAQLERLPQFVESKRELARRYIEAFAGNPDVAVFREPQFARSNYWLNALMLADNAAGLRDMLLAATNEAGLMTRPVWTLMHRLPMFRDCPRMDLSAAEALETRIVNIPSSAFLVDQLCTSNRLA